MLLVTITAQIRDRGRINLLPVGVGFLDGSVYSNEVIVNQMLLEDVTMHNKVIFQKVIMGNDFSGLVCTVQNDAIIPPCIRVIGTVFVKRSKFPLRKHLPIKDMRWYRLIPVIVEVFCKDGSAYLLRLCFCGCCTHGYLRSVVVVIYR